MEIFTFELKNIFSIFLIYFSRNNETVVFHKLEQVVSVRSALYAKPRQEMPIGQELWNHCTSGKYIT